MESFAPSAMVHRTEAAPLPPAAESQLLYGAPLPVAPDREITIVFAERIPGGRLCDGEPTLTARWPLTSATNCSAARTLLDIPENRGGAPLRRPATGCRDPA